MIYVTGDTHGEYERFTTKNFPEQRGLTKDDYVIICGDFGIWDDSAEENNNLDWLNDKPFTTLFVDGNHENYDLLNKYPVTEWHGGKAQFIRPSVIHLMRGHLFDIDGKRIFTMGGAASHDISDGILDPTDKDFKKIRKNLDKQGKYSYRIKGVSWWEEELPDDEDFATALATLDNCDWKVDYIISHCASNSIVSALNFGMADFDKLTDFFEVLERKCEFKKWFFGHYHDNIKFDEKHCLIYEKITMLE